MAAPIPDHRFKFAIARSDFIDAHNVADVAVRGRLSGMNVTPGATFGGNLDLLNNVAAGPDYSRKDKDRIDKLIAELRKLRSLRCDLVHSPMEVIVQDGIGHAFFPNVQQQTGYGRTGRLLTLQELKSFGDQVRAMAEKMKRFPPAPRPAQAPDPAQARPKARQQPNSARPGVTVSKDPATQTCPEAVTNPPSGI